MTVDLFIDLQVASSADNIPSEAQITHWCCHALEGHRRQAEVCVRIVDREESQQLNHQYRDKDYPTNVLSFPADLPPELELPLLGDLVVCAPVVTTEALEQKKAPQAHWAHMLIHGILHLLGYDHVDDSDAEKMEALETQLLTSLDYPPPYEPNP